MEIIATILLLGVFYFSFFYAIFETKIDYLKQERRLLLWYSHYEPDGSIKRKHITLWKFRKKPTKP